MQRPAQFFFRSLLILSLFAAPLAHAQEVKNGLTWYDDISKAYDVSSKSGKPIFAFFTGSDWCIWCHRLEQNVFDKPGFKAWAKNVVLLELDFPRGKKLPDNIAQQNNSLQQTFQVQGFPTVWLIRLAKDAATNKFAITPIGNLGDPQCEPGKEEGAFIKNANDILSKELTKK